MLNPSEWIVAPLPPDGPPLLGVVVDTEEEFDWSRPHSRSEIGVGHVVRQRVAHRIFDRYCIKPTYVVDYAVASQEAGYGPLRELFAEGKCDIGAHLHPWINPPFVEDVSVRNSYPGNLPEELERKKLSVLTTLIEQRFGLPPRIYRAGRYGVGPSTARILEDLDYEIDTSVVPRSDFRRDAGPDFRHCGYAPYWFGRSRRLLEIPLTVGWVGRFSELGAYLHTALQSKLSNHLHVGGILARLGFLERIRLSPEGITFDELKRLTDFTRFRGHRLFFLTYHSPSLSPGNTPYVRDAKELERFLGTIERYLEYFFGNLNGRSTTLQEVKAVLNGAARRPAAPAPLAAHHDMIG